MSARTAKENILKKIREALSESVPLPFPNSEGNSSVYTAPVQDMELEFAEQFTQLLGRFVFCLNSREMTAQLAGLAVNNKWTKIYCREAALRSLLEANGFPGFFEGDLADCDVSITGCEALVARTGSIVLSSAQESGRTVSVYAPIHICIAYTHQLVPDIRDALQLVKDKYQGNIPSLLSFATGPSRTADIEKTLVVGVHGPKEVYVFLVDEG